MTAPDSSESWVDPIFDAVVSEIQRSGYFSRVNKYEPKRKPAGGLTAAVWVQSISPVPAVSGLATTAAVLVFIIRIFSNMLKEPQDEIEPRMLKATANIMRRFHDNYDFDLPDIIRNVDLLGASGAALGAIAGYIDQDHTHFRIYDIQLPVIVHDAFPQNK